MAFSLAQDPAVDTVVIAASWPKYHVFIDPATKQKRPIPDGVRAALAPYVRDAEPAPTP